MRPRCPATAASASLAARSRESVEHLRRQRAVRSQDRGTSGSCRNVFSFKECRKENADFTTYRFFHPPRCPGAPPVDLGAGPNSGPDSRELVGWKILLLPPDPVSPAAGLRGRLPCTGLTSCHVAMPISSRSGL